MNSVTDKEVEVDIINEWIDRADVIQGPKIFASEK